jgi:hypothetical protein
MGNAFDVAMSAIFRDPNMATSAIWQAGGFGPVQPVRVLMRAPDVQRSWGEAAIVSSTSVIEVQIADLAEVSEGDTFLMAGQLYEVQGEPQRDEARLVWKAEVRPR